VCGGGRVGSMSVYECVWGEGKEGGCVCVCTVKKRVA
jgi:hypothetical protein